MGDARNSLLPTALAGLVGALVGAFVAGSLAPPPVASSSPVSAAPGLDARALEEVLAELSALRRQLELAPAAAAAVEPTSSEAQRTPVGSEVAVAGLDSVNARLDALTKQVQALVLREPSKPEILQPTGPPSHPLPVPNTSEFERERDTIRLMSYQQILDRYGKPSAVWVPTEGVVSWKWSLDDNHALVLDFTDGMAGSFRDISGPRVGRD